MVDLAAWPLAGVAALFVSAAGVIGYVGVKMTRLANRLAEVTGIGEAIFGAVVLGGMTSLSGVVTSVTAAADSHPVLAVSNALGGISAQTAFLALADLAYRRANLSCDHVRPGLRDRNRALMTGILLLGLLRREKSGIANIGFESFLVLLLYAGAVTVIFVQ